METQDTKPKRTKKAETKEEILERAEQFQDGPALSMTDVASYLGVTYSALPGIVKKHNLVRRRKGLGKKVFILVKELDELLNKEYIIGDEEGVDEEEE